MAPVHLRIVDYFDGGVKGSGLQVGGSATPTETGSHRSGNRLLWPPRWRMQAEELGARALVVATCLVVLFLLSVAG